MLERIETKEIMTTWDASKKYSTKYFCMIITEKVDPTGQNDLGYVIYTADSRRELSNLPRESYWGKQAKFGIGHYAEPLNVGRVIVYD